MKYTEINPQIGMKEPENDCIVVAFISKKFQQKINQLLKSLENKLGNIIWPMPSNALHITLMGIIEPKPYIENKAKLLKNLPHYEKVLLKVLDIGPITIYFDTIEVSPQAIIVKGHDDGTFNHVRKKLVEKLPLPNETNLPPNIVHCTIARFTKKVDIEEVKEIVSKFNINFVETIDEFQLLIETAPHIVNFQVAHKYQLG